MHVLSARMRVRETETRDGIFYTPLAYACNTRREEGIETGPKLNPHTGFFPFFLYYDCLGVEPPCVSRNALKGNG